MSKIISDEEIRKCLKALPAKPVMANFHTIAKAQRDASDQEWIEWIEQHQWQSQSLIPGISTIKGYLIRDEELQALKQEIKEQNE